MDATIRANKKADRETQKQVEIMYCIVAIVLWKRYGWKKLRIGRLFLQSQEVFEECAEAGTDKSMLSMLEDETGIEIRTNGMKSYHEYAYLNAEKWDGKPPTKMQLIYIRQQQMKWLPAVTFAGICLALYRKEGWGAERVSKFAEVYEDLKSQYGTDIKTYRELLSKETEYTIEELRLQYVRKKQE